MWDRDHWEGVACHLKNREKGPKQIYQPWERRERFEIKKTTIDFTTLNSEEED